jgi:hypothetical protein
MDNPPPGGCWAIKIRIGNGAGTYRVCGGLYDLCFQKSMMVGQEAGKRTGSCLALSHNRRAVNRLYQLRDATIESPMTISRTICRSRITVPNIPQIRPALVKSLPLLSIRPAAISSKSPLPIIHAATPQNGQSTSPRIPKTNMVTPRCGLMEFLSKSSHGLWSG